MKDVICWVGSGVDMAQINRSNSTIDDFYAYCTDLIFIASTGGALLRKSGAFSRALSPALDAEPEAALTSLIHPDDKAPFEEAWNCLRASAAPMKIDVRLKSADDSFRYFQCVARWVPEKEEVYGTLQDADERIKHDIKIKLLQAINDNLPVCLWAIDAQGLFVYQDGKATETAGMKRGQLVGLNMFDVYPPEGTGGVRRALAGETNCFINEVDGVHWEAWYLPMHNARGEVTHVAGVSLDITPAKHTEQDLRAKLEFIQKQQQVIRALSTPIIQVWDRVLTLPLVGMFDSTRAADVMESVLAEVVRTRARYAILDLTGIEAMDTATADHLLKLSQAIKLLGAEGIITGIHPAIAQTIVGLGLDLTSIATRSTLREGLQYCIQRMRREAK